MKGLWEYVLIIKA